MNRPTDSKLKEVQDLLDGNDLNGVLIASNENRRYLSGFSGSAGYLFITRKMALLLTDSRYVQQAQKEAPQFDVHLIDKASWFADLVTDMPKDSRIGYENRFLTVSNFDLLNASVQTINQDAQKRLTLCGLNGLLDLLRSIKTPDEILLMQKAATIADQSYEEVTNDFQGGISEKDLAWKIEMAIHRFGGDGPSFPTIVASGPNGALPHHQPSDKIINPNEPIVIDMGVRLAGYCSDMTRTLYIGNQDTKFRTIYDTVLCAQQTAIATVKSGMSGSTADSLARTIISNASYGEYFGHSLGHGIGIMVHEYPTLSPQSNDLLNDSMIFTIEPGIYIPDWGGIRIEDMILLQENNTQILTHAAKL